MTIAGALALTGLLLVFCALTLAFFATRSEVARPVSFRLGRATAVAAALLFLAAIWVHALI